MTANTALLNAVAAAPEALLAAPLLHPEPGPADVPNQPGRPEASPVHHQGLEPEQRSKPLRRIAQLVDRDSFVEFGALAKHRSTAFGMAERRPAGDGVVTGFATLAGRQVALFAQDSGVLGGSLGEVHAAKISRMLEHAGRAAIPVIGLLDSGGARIQEGVAALDGYGTLFRANVALSGKVPQISVVLGPCAGGAVYSPALTDIVIMTRRDAHMFLTGPRVVKAVTSEDVDADTLGGAGVHGKVSGVAHLVADDDTHALELAGRVLSYLPDAAGKTLPMAVPRDPAPMPELPAEHRRAYDVRGVVRGILDGDSFLELQPGFARNIVVGFGRIDGSPVGVVANQPMAMAGTLDIAAAEKAARFVRLCDAFGLPLVTLVDTPGFLPGTAQERGGVIRKGAKLLYAYAEATVPRVTVILRKAFGGAYIVMNSKNLGADAVYAWPGAQVAVMGAEGAVDIIHRRRLAADPGSRAALEEQYRTEVMTVRVPAERMSIDQLVAPADTRGVVAATLRSLAAAGRCGSRGDGYRHDNQPQ